MIKEYIDQLSEDNKEELSRLEEQMKSLLDELTYTQQWHENLQKESNAQTNIFSPRNLDSGLEENLENAQNKISKINQQIEYTRELIETHLKKKREYQVLSDEIKHNSKKEQIEVQKPASDHFEAERVKQLLNEIYKKTELSLAFLNSNKNKCKAELNAIKNMIKEYAQEVEK